MIAARLAAIALMAAAVATGLYFFTMHCGAVHGSPACGHASLPATAIAVAALALDSAIVGAAASEGSARSALACRLLRHRAGGLRAGRVLASDRRRANRPPSRPPPPAPPPGDSARRPARRGSPPVAHHRLAVPEPAPIVAHSSPDSPPDTAARPCLPAS